MDRRLSNRTRLLVSPVAAIVLLGGVPLLAGCGPRFVSNCGVAPTFYFRTSAFPATLNETAQGSLSSEAAGYAASFKYVLAQPRSVVLTAVSSAPEVPLDIYVFTDGREPIASSAGQVDKKLAVELPAGDIYVVVAEPWQQARDLSFQLNVVAGPVPR